MKMVKHQREQYYLRRTISLRDTNYMSLIIDGADQKDYGLPHFHQSTHGTQKMRMGVHVMGVLHHHSGKSICACELIITVTAPYAFTFLDNVKQGTNISIEVMHTVFTTSNPSY